ncbi:hypothetical protein HUW83_09975 [Fusobacterium animalis]|uniref:hypothetical protein n=1 Tax=Fusobacterium animalis TaxID=76859 RepID=UPI0030D1A3D1
MITITKKDEEIHIVQDDFLLKQSRVMELFYFIILCGIYIPIQTSIDNFNNFYTFFMLALFFLYKTHIVFFNNRVLIERFKGKKVKNKVEFFYLDIEDLKIFSKCKNKCIYYYIEIKIKGKKFLYVKTEFKKDIEEIFNIFLNIIEEKRHEKILY